MMRILRDIWRALVPRRLRLRFHVFRGGDALFRWRQYRRARGRVLGGPFRGLRYPPYAVGSEYFPKILGCYEQELHPVIEEWSGHGFSKVIVVGAGEGYYVGGLAMLFPDAELVSFEMDSEGRLAIDWMARRNHFMDRWRNHGLCGPDALGRALEGEGDKLLIMDVEGAERQLLDPEGIAGLTPAWILVEVHDCFHPGLGDLLRERFSASHEIREMEAIARSVSHLRGLPMEEKELARMLPLVDEKRPPGMRWFALRPKSPNAEAKR